MARASRACNDAPLGLADLVLAAQNRQIQARTHQFQPTTKSCVTVPSTRASCILPPARSVLSNGAQDAGRKRLIRRRAVRLSGRMDPLSWI